MKEVMQSNSKSGHSNENLDEVLKKHFEDYGFKREFDPTQQGGYYQNPPDYNSPSYPTQNYSPPSYETSQQYGQSFYRPHNYPPGHLTPEYFPNNLQPGHSKRRAFTDHYPSLAPYHWVDTTAYGGVPSTALQGGTDIDGHIIYVGRAFHEGDWIPAKVIPGKNVAYVAFNGIEHAKDRFQVLCEQRFHWLNDQQGRVPSDAVQGGKTFQGEPLYIGRVYHQGSLTVGKVHPSHGVCYIPFDGREIAYPNYEVLTLRR